MEKYSELQVLRNSLFDEITRIKRGTADINDTHALVKVANAIIGTYQTEIKAFMAINQAGNPTVYEDGTKLIDMFEKKEVNIIDYKAPKDETV